IIGFLITSALVPITVRIHPIMFSAILAGTILLLVYLWHNPLFLPMTDLLGSIGWRRKSRPRAAPRYQRQNLQVDEILDKIARTGIESLTAEEKAVLGEVSSKYQRQSDSKKPKSGLAI